MSTLRGLTACCAMALLFCSGCGSNENRRFRPPQGAATVPFSGVNGALWLTQTAEGITVMARVGEKLRNPSVTLSVKFAEHVAMPPIAWVSQFGKATCADKNDEGADQADKAACDAWQSEQVRYRAELVKQFERRWLMKPGSTADIRGLNGDAARSALPATTSALPALRLVSLGQETGMEIPIAWEQLPPANSLHLARVYIALEISEENAAHASIAQKAIDLPQAIDTSWTECEYSLNDFPGTLDDDQEEPAFPGWYFLNRSRTIGDAFVLRNVAEGYQYSPNHPSPEVQWIKRHSKRISARETVCWPDLRYEVGNFGNAQAAPASPADSPEIHRVADGALLATFGPKVETQSALGTGECGACPMLVYNIAHLSPGRKPEDAFDLDPIVIGSPRGPIDAEVRRSADWQTITVWKEEGDFSEPENGKWRSERFCLKGATYSPCGSGPEGPPPGQRQTLLN